MNEVKAPPHDGTPRTHLAPLLRLDFIFLPFFLLLLLLPAHAVEDLGLLVGAQFFLQPARRISLESRPNSLKFEKETSHDILSWRRRASMA